MKVSIVTVCFNAASTIEETIKSVLSQDCPNIEYLIKDGGSKDSTLKIVKKYGKRIDVVIEGKDAGLYDAMNIAVKKASGDVVFFLNADDVFYSKHVVSDAVKAFEKGIDFVYGDVNFYYPEEKISKRITRIASMAEIKKGSMPPHQATFVRRKLLLENLFDNSYRSSADFDWFCRIIKKGAVGKKIDRIIATVQIGGVSSGSVSYRETEAVIKKHFGFVPFAVLFVKHRVFGLLKKIFSILGLKVHKG
ncbi:MAG: glycosyltransferase family 2 protein [archaeon]